MNTMMTRALSSACLGLLATTACTVDTSEGVDDVTLGAHSDALVGTVTTATTHRREVGRWGGCTATAIAPRWIITAAHCWDYLDTIDTSSAPHVAFETSNDGRAWGAGACTGCQTIEADRTFPFTSETQLAGPDVMLVRLKTPLDTSFLTPATIATSMPTSGNVTTYGLGCTVWGSPSDGQMRWASSAVGATSNMLCPGDSGGPRFAGNVGGRGAIVGINSGSGGGGDVFGDPISRRAQILNIISAWDGAPELADIGSNSWCTGAAQRVYWGDVDGDQLPDAICHDRATGNVWVAENRNRLIAQTSYAGVFCNGANATLQTGDFNGDGRTDLLCRTPVTGGIDQVVFTAQASAAARFSFTGAPLQRYTTHWCSHPGASLYTGDFNGDGRSDLLCHDAATGDRWIDFADGAGRFSGGTDNHRADGWCSHASARVHVGDFNRDGRSDLACFTRDTGFLHVQLSAGGAVPFTGINHDEMSATVDTGVACTTASTCQSGQTCESGTCRERLCKQSGTLMVGDFSGDAVSDFVCEQPNGRTFGVRPFAGLPSATDGRTILQTTGGYFIGWGGKLRLRTLRAAAQTWR